MSDVQFEGVWIGWFKNLGFSEVSFSFQYPFPIYEIDFIFNSYMRMN